MKKILIVGLIVLVVGFLSSVGYAEIRKGIDDFDNSVTITSRVARENGRDLGLYTVTFTKLKSANGSSSYWLALSQTNVFIFERALWK